MIIDRRRVYIIPTRFGIMLALILAAMALAGLNYNSNLGLAFAFLMISMGLVTMHHCNRNLLRLAVDATTEVDAFAGGDANFDFELFNDSNVDRGDIEIRAAHGASMGSVPAGGRTAVTVRVPVTGRGTLRIPQIELRTRYPFGWFHAWTYVQSPLTAYVAPLPAGSQLLPPAGAQGAAAHAESPGEEDFAGLRAYQPGMALKHMAWKVLARGGEAAVRTYSSLAAQPEWLDWSALEGQDEESRLSQLCLWVLQSDAASRRYGLRIPGTEIAPSAGAAHRLACLRALASYGTEHPSHA